MAAITKLTERFTETELDDEIVVMRLDTGDFFALSDTAAATWKLIDGTRDRQGLLAELARSFDANEQDIAKDVDEFLGRLGDMGLLAFR